MLAVWRNQSSNDEHVEKAVLQKISSEHRWWSWAEDFLHNFLQQFVKDQFSHLRLLVKEHFGDCPFKTGFFKRESKTRFTWDHFFNKSWRTFPCKSSRAGNLEDFWRQEDDLPKIHLFCDEEDGKTSRQHREEDEPSQEDDLKDHFGRKLAFGDWSGVRIGYLDRAAEERERKR